MVISLRTALFSVYFAKWMVAGQELPIVSFLQIFSLKSIGPVYVISQDSDNNTPFL